MTATDPLSDLAADMKVLRAEVTGIAKRLDRVVYQDLYELRHEQLMTRVTQIEQRQDATDREAEEDREAAATERRRIIYGVAVALLIPSLGFVDDLLRWIVGQP